jgi:Mg/Co/Ni transporter MgtE
MTDAQEAVIDIVEALTEYGSGISINVITEGVYDPTTGLKSKTTVSTNTKGLPRNYNSAELSDKIFVTDMEFRLYFSGTIAYKDTITYQSKTYTIMNIYKKVLQNTLIMYTIQGRI